MEDLKLLKFMKYESVAASQTGQVLGATGAAGDIVQRIIIVPSNLNPGKVDLQDGANNATAMNVFIGGTASINELRPMVVECGLKSVNGAWKINTGANVIVHALGVFS